MKKKLLPIIAIIGGAISWVMECAYRGCSSVDNNSLVLSSSGNIYNHGSHASHASHCSHYSMSITIKKDSIRDISKEEKIFIINSLAAMYKCSDKDIDIMKIYISRNNEIVTQEKGASAILRYKPAPNEKCLYISYRKWTRSEYSSFNIHEYVIPLVNRESNCFHIGDGHHYNVEKKEKWMIDFIKNHK